MSSVPCAVIVACCQSSGIGKDGSIPWYIAEDLSHFRRLTTHAPEGKQNAVIMGRKTWESLGCKCLPKRYNIVISTTLLEQDHVNVTIVRGLNEALQVCSKENVNCAYIIGGTRLYTEALSNAQCNTAYVTHILRHYECDTFFPTDLLMDNFSLVREGSIQTTANQISFTFCEYNRLKNTKI
jgi:dihydrofolate reductase